VNEDEKRIAEAIYGAIQDTSRYSARSQQAAEFRVGVSDLGFCSERTRRMLDQQVPEDSDVLKAWIGTALGDHMEQAMLRVWPHGIRQSEVYVTLHGEEREYALTGHPDFIVPDEGIVLDAKSAYGLDVVERTGPSESQQYQRHCYAKAAWLAGMFPEGMALEDVRVGNVWIDRAGIDQRLHVQMEPYDESIVQAAGMWLDNVVYAYLQGEEAQKEPPREMCAKVCGFFSVCRAYDTDVEGLLTDPVALTAVDLYQQGSDLERQGKRLKDQAKQHLVGVQGSTGKFMVRWTHVNASEVNYTRGAYDKLEVRKVKGA
jgi:hypothetical protein